MKIGRLVPTLSASALVAVAGMASSAACAQVMFDTPKNFVVSEVCEAYTSIRNENDPVPLTIGRGYRALGENRTPGATHAFLEVNGQRKWAALTCGDYDGTPVGGGNGPDECLPFFDDENNPVSLPQSGVVDVTPPAPAVLPFGQAVNAICGAPGKRVSRDEFRAMFSDHPEVLDRIQAYTGGRVYADRSLPASRAAYLEDLTDAWLAIHGFDHIFCGEPKRGGSIGGFHFRGRYLQLQQRGLACRMAGNRDDEEVQPGSIYTVGVVMQVNGGIAKQEVKGYGLTLSAEDIFKVATRALVENPTESSGSTGCLLTVEDDGESFVTVFVRRKAGIRTFYPDATPDTGRNRACAEKLVLPATGSSGRPTPVREPLGEHAAAVHEVTVIPIPRSTFTDPAGRESAVAVALENGQPLPDWAYFDAAKRTLLFLPECRHAGTRLNIIVTVDGGQGEVADTLALRVVGVD